MKEENLLILPRFGNKSSNNLVIAINKSKKTSFNRFVYGLGINNVGEHIARVLGKHFKSNLEKFITTSRIDLEKIDGVGPNRIYTI